MTSKTIKAVKGASYKLKHTDELGFSRDGNYEYIGRYGNKMHFYDNIKGYDLFLNKNDFIEKLTHDE